MPVSLKERLERARTRWKSLRFAEGVALGLTLLGCLVLTGYSLDRTLQMTSSGRWAWFLSFVLFAIFALVRFVWLPGSRPIRDEEIALAVERAYPNLGERLLSTVELAAQPTDAGTSGELVRELAAETERLSAALDFGRAVPVHRTRRAASLCASVAAVTLLTAALAPDAFAVVLSRLFAPGADIAPYAATRVWIAEAPELLPRGSDLEVGIQTTGVPAREVTAHFRLGGGKWTRAILRPDSQSGGGFRLRLEDLQDDLVLYATANDGRSNARRIRVADRPAILGVKMVLDFPDYMGRKAETVEGTSGNLVAPAGTRARVEVEASKPLAAVEIRTGTKALESWLIEGVRFRGELWVLKDSSWAVALRDTEGLASEPNPEFTIRAQPDQTPTVRVEAPASEIERTPTGTVSLRAAAQDDYSITATCLTWRAAKRSGSLGLPLTKTGSAKSVISAADWRLDSVRAGAGETIEFEVRARDNDTVTGPKEGKSSTLRVRIVSHAEMRERLEARAAEELAALKELIRRQKNALSEMRQARRQTDLSRGMQSAANAERDLARETAELARKMESTSREMIANGVTTKPEQDRRAEASRTLDDVSRNDLARAAQAADRSAAQRSLEEAAEAQRNAESALAKLESVNAENAEGSGAFELARKALELAAEQEKLADEAALAAEKKDALEPMTPSEKSAIEKQRSRQKQLREATERLKQEIARSARRAAEQQSPDSPDLQAAAKMAQESGVTAKQSQAEQQLAAGQPNEASKLQTGAEKDLRNLASQLQRAGEAQRSAEQAAAEARRLEKLADEVEQMAREQSSAASQLRRNPDANTMKRLGEQERSLQQRSNEAASKTGSAQEAKQSLERAASALGRTQESIGKNNQPDASANANEASRQLFRASMDLRDAARALQEEQESKQAARDVERLAREQRELLRNTSGFDKARGRAPLNDEQKQQAGQLAAQQSALMNRAMAMRQDMPTRGFEWALGEAARRMENASRGLDQQNTGEDTRRHQEHTAQMLERLARSLGQQSQAAEQQRQAGEQGQSGQQQPAEAAGELQLAREMEAQIRQETAGLEDRRRTNPGGNLSAEQQRELNYLSQAQRETRRIAQRAMQQLRGQQQIAGQVEQAIRKMEDAQEMLQRSQTGQSTQTAEQQAVDRLDQAVRMAQEQMNQQRQQMAQQRQQQRQGQQRMAQDRWNPGLKPAERTTAPIVAVKTGPLLNPAQVGRGFRPLGERQQQALRDARKEKMPAEYRDLIERYYKSLSEKGK